MYSIQFQTLLCFLVASMNISLMFQLVGSKTYLSHIFPHSLARSALLMIYLFYFHLTFKIPTFFLSQTHTSSCFCRFSQCKKYFHYHFYQILWLKNSKFFLLNINKNTSYPSFIFLVHVCKNI